MNKWESFEKTYRERREMVPHLPQSAESFEGRRRDQYHVCSITSAPPPERMGSSCIWRHKRLIGIAYNGRKYRQCFQHGNNSSSPPPRSKGDDKMENGFSKLSGWRRRRFCLFFFFFKGETKTGVKPLKVHQRLRAEEKQPPRIYPKALAIHLFSSISLDILVRLLLRLIRVLWPRQSTT